MTELNIPKTADVPCRQDPDAWFMEKNAGVTAKAKAGCLRCEFTSACLAYALPRAVEGVWGATTTDERKALQQRAGIVPQPIVTLPYHGNRKVAS